MNAHDILTNARDIMAERGKAEGDLMNQDGQVCIRGAMALAWGYNDLAGADLGELPADFRAIMGECELLMGFVPVSWHPYTDAAAWNNDPEVTTEMVLDRFEQGIEASAPQRELVLA